MKPHRAGNFRFCTGNTLFVRVLASKSSDFAYKTANTWTKTIDINYNENFLKHFFGEIAQICYKIELFATRRQTRVTNYSVLFIGDRSYKLTKNYKYFEVPTCYLYKYLSYYITLIDLFPSATILQYNENKSITADQCYLIMIMTRLFFFFILIIEIINKMRRQHIRFPSHDYRVFIVTEISRL